MCGSGDLSWSRVCHSSLRWACRSRCVGTGAVVALGLGVHEAGPQGCLAQLARLRVPKFVCGLVTSFPSSLFEDPSTEP